MLKLRRQLYIYNNLYLCLSLAFSFCLRCDGSGHRSFVLLFILSFFCNNLPTQFESHLLLWWLMHVVVFCWLYVSQGETIWFHVGSFHLVPCFEGMFTRCCYELWVHFVGSSWQVSYFSNGWCEPVWGGYEAWHQIPVGFQIPTLILALGIVPLLITIIAIDSLQIICEDIW